MSSREQLSTLALMKTPQWEMRTQYTVLYMMRFPHLGIERSTSKAFNTSDREIGRGDWEIPMPEKPEPKLIRVRAEIGDYVSRASGMCLRVGHVGGGDLSAAKATFLRDTEHIYWKRCRWKMMTIPFVNYLLKQGGFYR